MVSQLWANTCNRLTADVISTELTNLHTLYVLISKQAPFVLNTLGRIICCYYLVLLYFVNLIYPTVYVACHSEIKTTECENWAHETKIGIII